MTLDEIAYNIKNIVEGGISGEDSDISIRQIKSMIHYHRAQLLMQYTNLGRTLSEKMYSHSRATITSGWMSLPEMVGFPNNRALISVVLESQDKPSTNLSSSTIIPFYNEQDSQFHITSRFAPSEDKIYAVIDGDASRLRFFQGEDAYVGGIIAIKYIAAKPSDTGGGYYPVPDELVPDLIKRILSLEFSVMTNVLNDSMNNSLDDKIMLRKMQQEQQQQKG